MFEELFKTKDAEVIKTELSKLNKALVEWCEAGARLVAVLPDDEEKRNINEMLEAEKLSISEVEKMAEKMIEEINEEESKSQHSRGSKRSGRSIRSKPNTESQRTKNEENERSEKDPGERIAQARGAASVKSGMSRLNQMRGDKVKYGSVRSSKSGRSGRSNQSNRTEKDEASEEILSGRLNRVTVRFENQLLYLKDLLVVNDIDMIKRELDLMEQMHRTLETVSEKMMSVTSIENGRKINDTLTQMEQKMFDTKKDILQWMAVINEEEDKSVISRSSRRTMSSYNSNLSMGRKIKDEDDLMRTEEMKQVLEEQKDVLNRQKAACKDALVSNKTTEVRKEVLALEKTHQNVITNMDKLQELLPMVEAQKMNEWAEKEEDEVLEIKKWMINNMISRKEGASADENTNKELVKDEKEEEGKKKFEDRNIETNEAEVLKEEVSRMKCRVGKQRELVKDLLMADDVEMMNRELEALDKVYDDLVAAASQLRVSINTEEARQLSNLIDAEDTEVFQVKKKVALWRASMNKKEKDEVKEETKDEKNSADKQGEDILELKREIESMKKAGTMRKIIDDDQTKKEVARGKSRSIDGSGRKEPSGHPNSVNEQGNLIELNKLMVETLKIQSAPTVEIDPFSGDPLEFNYFIETFKDVVENWITDPRQRLVRLLKYTEGEAKELIKHCVYDETTSCYETALQLLKKEYGNPIYIACAHLEKLKSWQQIKANDAKGLKTLYRFLLRCLAFQKIGVLELDSPLLLRNIQLSLPTNLQDRWAGKVGKIRNKSGEEAKFQDMLNFIEEETRVLNDPIYSRNGFKESKKTDERIKVNKTEVSEEAPKHKKQECELCKLDHSISKCPKIGEIRKEEERKNENKIICIVCSEGHDIDDCEQFSKKDARAKKDFLFTNKMCFACYGKGHRVKECKNKRTCKNCGESHPTALHEVSFKVHVIHKEAEAGALCIVPVRLSHPKCPGKEIEVYAMLDFCSNGTFMDEDLLKDFEDSLEEEEKRQTTIRITTATNQEGKISESVAVTGLVVKSGYEEEGKHGPVNINLPVTYTKQELPMDKEDVLKSETVKKWEYLKPLWDAIPKVKDIPFGLLIGNNCPKALEPMQVISSEGQGPFAQRTRLGWCVVGAGGIKNGVSTKCNATKMNLPYATRNESQGSTPSQLVIHTDVQDNAISDTLREMWRTDFIERQSEKTAMSKEDRKFLEIMKNNVHFNDGHYVLPLPLKTQKFKSRDSPHEKEEISRAKPEDNDKTSPHSHISIMSSSKVAELSADVHTNKHTEQRPTKEVECVVMPENRYMALQRLKISKRRMDKDNSYKKEYSEFMAKLFRCGYARQVPTERLHERAWYLTHHGVRHPTKKKIRVVFHCSQEKEGVSLNSRLMQGPDFMNSMLGVLLRFRKGAIPIMADIESMYYQVHVPDDDCRFMRFFWWNDEAGKEPVECEMCVHSFGAVSSKNCVIFALHQTATDHQDEFGEEAANTLVDDFYMDDLAKSLDDEIQAINLIKNVDKMCAAGGFNLTKFVCGNHKVLESIPIEKRAEGLKEYSLGKEMPTESALGVSWNVSEDTFGFRVCFKTDNGTRRGCLATISRMHDPLGIAAPFLLKGKKILQKMTAASSSWDDPLEPRFKKEWEEWKDEVMLLKKMKIKRSYRREGMRRVVSSTLHCFSDASFTGYGVACYLRMVDEDEQVEVALVMGKARVSPLQPTTVPRLELVAAVVSVRIAALLIEELKIHGMEVTFWADNKVVLGYILNQTRRYRVFVANRVQVIDNHMKEAGLESKERWKYVETKENPSDFASRGISPKDDEKVDVWMNGPLFLRKPGEEWRERTAEIHVVENDPEVKANKTCNTLKLAVGKPVEGILETFERRISSWNRMKRAMVWVLRFTTNAKIKEERDTEKRKVRFQEGCSKDLFRRLDTEGMKVNELEEAERKLITLMQERSLSKERKEAPPKAIVKGKAGSLKKLNPFIDENGILRVGGRLSNAQEEVSFRHPAIVPKGTVCTRRLIEWHHQKIAHRGKHTTVSTLREHGWWIINSGKEVGAVVFKCVRCKWLRGRFVDQIMANLPISRLSIEPPFTYCGVDLFGPLLVKEGRKELKRYGVLFTCLSLRAVHIEVASSLETDSFLQALRRFVARRGAVREIRSDNGTNLVGAENEIKQAVKEMDHEKVRSFLNEQGGDWIVFERNAPKGSHMGGAWERQIRTVKNVLSALVKECPRRLDEEMLRTFFAEAEAIVNSRPLTLENLNDPDSSPLTPNQLLTMKSKLVSPPPGVFQKSDVYCRKRWRVTQHLANSFWSRWRKEYLQLLQPRQKWTEEKKNLQIDDVVLIKEEGSGRGHWPMARVTEVHRSDDGMVRSVSLQVKKSVLKRPVHKTILLVSAKREEPEEQNEEKK